MRLMNDVFSAFHDKWYKTWQLCQIFIGGGRSESLSLCCSGFGFGLRFPLPPPPIEIKINFSHFFPFRSALPSHPHVIHHVVIESGRAVSRCDDFVYLTCRNHGGLEVLERSLLMNEV